MGFNGEHETPQDDLGSNVLCEKTDVGISSGAFDSALCEALVSTVESLVSAACLNSEDISSHAMSTAGISRTNFSCPDNFYDGIDLCSEVDVKDGNGIKNHVIQPVVSESSQANYVSKSQHEDDVPCKSLSQIELRSKAKKLGFQSAAFANSSPRVCTIGKCFSVVVPINENTTKAIDDEIQQETVMDFVNRNGVTGASADPSTAAVALPVSMLGANASHSVIAAIPSGAVVGVVRTLTIDGRRTQKENVPESPKTRPRVAGRNRARKSGRSRFFLPAPRSATIASGTVATKRPADPTIPAKLAKQNSDELTSRCITDYFQPRRSRRKTEAELIKSKQLLMHDKILRADEAGFRVVNFKDKGRGVVSDVDLRSGEFVLEYAGDLVDLKEARKREDLYAKDPSVGCYMYYFQHGGSSYCIDATSESERLGRLINHSIRDANLKTKSITVGCKPRLVFIAKRDISAGEELLYDYGDRRKLTLQSHPWLKD